MRRKGEREINRRLMYGVRYGVRYGSRRVSVSQGHWALPLCPLLLPSGTENELQLDAEAKAGF